MVNIPIEFDEAARIDGAGDFSNILESCSPSIKAHSYGGCII